MFKTKATLLIVISFLLCSCGLVSPHRIEISQGNHYDLDAVAQLRLGMTPAQVKYLLGSPAIDNLYADQRWDYIYYQDNHSDPLSNQRLSLWFAANGKLERASSNHFNLEHLKTSAKPQ